MYSPSALTASTAEHDGDGRSGSGSRRAPCRENQRGEKQHARQQGVDLEREFDVAEASQVPPARLRLAPGIRPVVLNRAVAQIRVDGRHVVLHQLCGQRRVPDEVGCEIGAIVSDCRGRPAPRGSCTGTRRRREPATAGKRGCERRARSTVAALQAAPRGCRFTANAGERSHGGGRAASFAPTRSRRCRHNRPCDHKRHRRWDARCNHRPESEAREPVPELAPRRPNSPDALPNSTRPSGQPGRVART